MQIKEGLIETRVNKWGNISQKIKEFINQKYEENNFPFPAQATDQGKRSHNKAKRSLTDWRQLYNKNSNKIVPRHTVYPATADGNRIRCTMTGQCNRRKIYSSSNSKSFHGERLFQTRQSKRERISEVKRESMIQFAIAQNCYQRQILNDRSCSNSKERKFYQLSAFDRKRRSFCKVGQFLSNIQRNQKDQQKKANATQNYINQLNQQFERTKIRTCNNAKIKNHNLIKNDHLFDLIQINQAKGRVLNSENGLRYYERP